MKRIPDHFEGSVHVEVPGEGFKVLAAGDEVPEGVEVGDHILNAPKPAADDDEAGEADEAPARGRSRASR